MLLTHWEFYTICLDNIHAQMHPLYPTQVPHPYTPISWSIFNFFKCFFYPWKCVFVCFCMWVSACDCLWLSSEARRGELQYPLELKFSLEPKFPVELKFQVIEIKLIWVLGSMLEPSTREKVQLIVKPSPAVTQCFSQPLMKPNLCCPFIILGVGYHPLEYSGPINGHTLKVHGVTVTQRLSSLQSSSISRRCSGTFSNPWLNVYCLYPSF